MDLIYNNIFLGHSSKYEHPENPKRLQCFGNLEEKDIENGEKYLQLVYDKNYISNIIEASKKELNLDEDTYTCSKSYDVACHAAGAAVMAARQNDFALIRPPGHHATKDKAMGFCLFNNVAIAAKWLAEKGKKVFIIDIDGHHGNGTQDIFYGTDKVLFLSLHQFPAYPGTGWTKETGEGHGRYHTINLPFPSYSSDDIFTGALSKIIPAIKEQFKPDVVCVSAGFDGHKDDPLLKLNLTVNSYFEAGKLLSDNFKNIFACLEGGYNTSVLPSCVSSFIIGINKGKSRLKFNEQRTVSAANVQREFESRMENLRLNLDGYWGF